MSYSNPTLMYTISSLSGYFDGYNFHKGPVSIEISNGFVNDIRFQEENNAEINGKGKILSLPFCDGHTHLIFSGKRFFELNMKLEGKTYSEILEKGGGITYTVKETRNTDTNTLSHLVRTRLDVMLSNGCLLVEAKSGYGLSLESEIRLLETLREIDKHHPISISPTFAAAHVFPPELSHQEYLDLIIEELIPIVKNRELADSTDVFCDRGAFSVEETIEIFSASLSANIPVRVHAEELEYTGIGKIAAKQFDALSADHLLLAKRDDFEILSENNTVAMFMPLAPLGLFSSNKPQGFQDTNVTIGLGSDFNPNNWVASIQTAIRMSVYSYSLTPTQALRAATTGSYQGITGKVREKLNIGSKANFILLNSESPEEFVSKFGQNLVDSVYKDGKKIHQNNHPIC